MKTTIRLETTCRKNLANKLFLILSELARHALIKFRSNILFLYQDKN